MAVQYDLLYPVMRAIISKRDDAGFTTNTRALRALLEYGDKDAEYWLEDDQRRRLGFPEYMAADVITGKYRACYINPRGMVFAILTCGHSDFAGLVTGVCDPERLNRAGWVHVSDGRIDLEYTLTPAQERVVDSLMQHGCFRINDTRSGRNPPDSYEQAGIPLQLHVLAPLSSYDWQDQRYWEDRGISRVGHAIRPAPNVHIKDWESDTVSRLWGFHPYNEPCLKNEPLRAKALQYHWGVTGKHVPGRLMAITDIPEEYSKEIFA